MRLRARQRKQKGPGLPCEEILFLSHLGSARPSLVLMTFHDTTCFPVAEVRALNHLQPYTI